MEYKILLKAGMKQHKGSFAGIFLLILLVSVALGTVLSIWSNSERFLVTELKRAGFGDATAWVSGVPENILLQKDIAAMEEVADVQTQNLLFSNYAANEQESDSEGQLIAYDAEEMRYRFFEDGLYGYREDRPDILPGEIYVSPSLVSMFGIKIGDSITFPIARNGGTVDFTVKGFYEDPFMGSSMIGMKGFLICRADYEQLVRQVNEAEINGLARTGAMLHIFVEENHRTDIAALINRMNSQTALSEYTEFVYGVNTIQGFMLILQNAFSGFLIAFVLVLLGVVVVVLGHSIGSTIAADYVNMGILKTIGLTTGKLRTIQLLQYTIAITAGMALGVIVSIPVSGFVSQMTLTTTGILIPAKLPSGLCILIFSGILMLLLLFVSWKANRIGRIAPMKAIRGETEQTTVPYRARLPVIGKGLHMRLALRQFITGWRKYVSAGIVAVLLVFIASLAGRMNAWLGPDGKGMMDAFNPADHDLGVQPIGDLTIEEIEQMIRSYTDFTDSYLLAMPNMSVNGSPYNINVISEPERFHMLAGTTCNGENEIVVTEFVAANQGIAIGDSVTVQGDQGSRDYVVSGIYQCANDMGENIGMSRSGYLQIGQDNPHIWCYHYFLADTTQKGVITERLENTYGGDVHVHENTWPGLFGIIAAMRALLVFLYSMTMVFILIVTAMTGNKILLVEQRDLGIYKALGFSTGRLRRTFALRFCLTAVAGTVIGSVLAAVFADPLISMVMRLVGISNFASNPNLGTVLLPGAVVIVLFTGFAYLAAGKIKRIALTILISE